jgi:hypothetical protein
VALAHLHHSTHILDGHDLVHVPCRAAERISRALGHLAVAVPDSGDAYELVTLADINTDRDG